MQTVRLNKSIDYDVPRALTRPLKYAKDVIAFLVAAIPRSTSHFCPSFTVLWSQQMVEDKAPESDSRHDQEQGHIENHERNQLGSSRFRSRSRNKYPSSKHSIASSRPRHPKEHSRTSNHQWSGTSNLNLMTTIPPK